MKLTPYLDMKGKAEEAIEFYKTALHAEVEMMMRFKDMPTQEGENCQMPAELEEKIMHATLKIDGAELMMSDSPEPGAGPAEFKGVTLSIGTDDLDKATAMFNALTQGGEVKMPLDKTFWSRAFGMVDDKFGVSWMVNVD